MGSTTPPATARGVDGCTCPPYPSVDMTEPYFRRKSSGHSREFSHNEESKDANRDCRRLHTSTASTALLDACRTHGCFHVRISPPPSIGVNPPLNSLCGGIDAVGAKIEKLFQPETLRTAGVPFRDDSCGGVPDEGTHAISFVPHDGFFQKSPLEATFRGRKAESGSAYGSSGGEETAVATEPKQSWEFQRCRGRTSVRPGAYAGKGDTNPAGDLGSLTEWTDALHSVAVCAIRELGFSPNSVLAEDGCACRSAHPCESSQASSEEEKEPAQRSEERCSIDLLRAFRYDALPSETERSMSPGSSPHTDWGSLTVVWQDGAGGLQTYCEPCGRWNDVPAPQSSSSTSPGDEGRESSSARSDAEHAAVNLFVHVGDYLSLATAAAASRDKRISVWPSPRHCVLCPLQLGKGSSGGISSGRVSLVYFAYPPLGVSLADTNNAMDGIGIAAAPAHVDPCIPRYGRYSLLQDQSKQTHNLSGLVKSSNGKTVLEEDSRLMFERIQTLSFEQVVREKWCQVQRG